MNDTNKTLFAGVIILAVLLIVSVFINNKKEIIVMQPQISQQQPPQLIEPQPQPEIDPEPQPQVYIVKYSLSGTRGLVFNNEPHKAQQVFDDIKSLDVFPSLFTLTRGNEVTVCYNLEGSGKTLRRFYTLEEASSFKSSLDSLGCNTGLITAPCDKNHQPIPIKDGRDLSDLYL